MSEVPPLVRLASRHMPRFSPQPIPVVGWLFISCVLAVGVYFAIAKPGALLIMAIALTALFLMSRQLNKRDARKLQTLASQRKGQSICEFARDFDARAVDTWIIRAVYEQLQEHLNYIHPAFPVRADDRLKEDLLLDDDDLDIDLVDEVEARTGISIAESDSNPYFGKVKTVRDLVLFFQNQLR
jgi:hypothetical protein